MKTRDWRGALFLSALAVAESAPAAAQVPLDSDFTTTPHWVIGYAANIPDQLLGFSGLVLGPQLGGWGIYVDVKRTTDSPADRSDFEPSLTAEEVDNQFGDFRFSDQSAWTTVNVAAVRVLKETFAVYAGAGYSKETAYARYQDPTFTRGVAGFYWVEDDRESGNRINFIGGAWFRATSLLMLQLGGETAPAGFTMGAGLVLPIGR